MDTTREGENPGASSAATSCIWRTGAEDGLRLVGQYPGRDSNS
jgi:hypothetical protein